MAPLRVVGIDFDHMHMGDLLREVHEHADATIAGICDADPRRMQAAIANFAIGPDRVFTDVEACLAATKPDLVVLCAAPAAHARYVEQIAPSGAHIVVEKPFATSAAEARRMIAAVKPGQKLAGFRHRRDHAVGVCDRGREGLFHQDVDARRRDALDPHRVLGGGGT